jgi:predicted MPP superfamily phosphohydrolase
MFTIFYFIFFPGHTHGGQMFPIIIGAYLFNPFYFLSRTHSWWRKHLSTMSVSWKENKMD